jgi:hypothetical protein
VLKVLTEKINIDPVVVEELANTIVDVCGREKLVWGRQ